LAITVFTPFLISPARAEDVAPAAVTTIVTPGGDDSSYRIPLTTSVVYDGITYNNVYATTNSVITFGNPDGTYWTYPRTPSISIESRDWWALPSYMSDTHFIISVSDGGFQVDGAYRPFGSFTGDVTNIVVTAQIQTDGTVVYSYATSGPVYADDRTGARLNDGTIVTLEQAGVTQVAVPPALEPTPVDPAPSVDPTPAPVEPTPAPPAPVAPAPQAPVQSNLPPTDVPPADTPVETPPPAEPVPAPSPAIADPTPLPVEVAPVQDAPVSESTPSEPPLVTLPNGVSITPQVATALALFNSPAQMLNAIFTNPSEALTAIANIGADMRPEVRVKAQKVVIASIIAGNIAVSAAMSASTVAYRRKP
jgi:hypothetical protein